MRQETEETTRELEEMQSVVARLQREAVEYKERREREEELMRRERDQLVLEVEQRREGEEKVRAKLEQQEREHRAEAMELEEARGEWKRLCDENKSLQDKLQAQEEQCSELRFRLA